MYNFKKLLKKYYNDKNYILTEYTFIKYWLYLIFKNDLVYTKKLLLIDVDPIVSY